MDKKRIKATIKAPASGKTVRSRGEKEKKESTPKQIPSLEMKPKIQTAYSWQQEMLRAKKGKKA